MSLAPILNNVALFKDKQILLSLSAGIAATAALGLSYYYLRAAGGSQALI